MRSRTFLALLLVTLVSTAVLAPSIAHAGSVLAQQEGTENENAEGGDEGGGGQSEADAETGAGEEEAEGAATEEEGPPWTYQMAKISILLVLVFLIGMGVLYYRLIGSRQGGAAG